MAKIKNLLDKEMESLTTKDGFIVSRFCNDPFKTTRDIIQIELQ